MCVEIEGIQGVCEVADGNEIKVRFRSEANANQKNNHADWLRRRLSS